MKHRACFRIDGKRPPFCGPPHNSPSSPRKQLHLLAHLPSWQLNLASGFACKTFVSYIVTKWSSVMAAQLHLQYFILEISKGVIITLE